jgi:hypothetical protein
MAEHTYEHATVLVEGQEMAESQTGTVGVKGTTSLVKTAGHIGTIRPKNPMLDATISMKFQVPDQGPEFNFMQSLQNGDLLDITVEDALFDGDYLINITDISMDDDKNGEKSYTLNGAGWKVG